ncbi:YkgJ family cysteine cluster protein [Thermaerobacillus caldiproteolyticus]|uniref:Fe-S-cluster containining protein n=1 Tax=Thermaerobacillus caldiproteolyticus TaxID=247480 RepID=A0A7W0BZB9_9BACL|nr:YkgJ family cysteine cluster protein [Anoxybacillus caldiproteolyticus]MBA2876621.1 Fe-S-cluster containining protein [Anoxybacillus caldiproteolyticus]
MERHLTYIDIVNICKKINEKYLPTDEPFIEKVDELFAQYDEEPPLLFLLRAFQELLQLVDEQIHDIEQKVNIRPTCAKGCAHCCYFPIIITKLEARLIQTYIDRLPAKEREEIQAHLRTYFQQQKEALDVVYAIDFMEDARFKEKYIAKQVPCPFLDVRTNTCRIYEVRPIPCRTYLNYASPAVCAKSHMPDEPFSYEFFYHYYMQSLQEIVEEWSDEEEAFPFRYPDDLFHLDYLPRLLQEE